MPKISRGPDHPVGVDVGKTADVDGETTLPLFPDAGPRYIPFRENIGFVPYSIIDPWGSPEARAREVSLKELVGDRGQSRQGVLGGRPKSIMTNQASIFSPVFTETLLTVYAPRPSALVLDPFAGGGTRAVMCALMGYQYRGVELREQEAERVRGALARLGMVRGDALVFTGDATDPSGQGVKLCKAGGPADFLLTCPPYWCLERYGGGERDISEGSYEEYLDGLQVVLEWTLDALRPEALAVWVLGNLMDPGGGGYVDIRADFSVLAREVGWGIHDLPVLKQKVGTAGQRVGASAGARRLVRIHEYAVVLRKP